MLGGRSLAHAVSMLIPEAYQGRGELPQPVERLLAYHDSADRSRGTDRPPSPSPTAA